MTKHTSIPVHIIVYPGFKALEAVGPLSVFNYANMHLKAAGHPGGYAVTLASTQVGAVPSDTLMSLDATELLPASRGLHTVMVVGAHEIERVLTEQSAITDWLQKVAPGVPRLVALCSGSFFFAAAGLLNGSRATTHWSVSDRLRKRFPKVNVQPDAIYIQEGHLWTSAGVTAATDIALAFVESDYGRDVALAVARDLVVFLKRPGGQAQFSTVLESQVPGQPMVQKLQDWMVANYSRSSIRMSDLAALATMSERNLLRVFTQETGKSPMEFLEQVRLERARIMLEDLSVPLKLVADLAGFSNDQQMRRAFQRSFGIAPRAYREHFATSLRSE
jgi:transcriptional regulator GlxA family with amidase domain